MEFQMQHRWAAAASAQSKRAVDAGPGSDLFPQQGHALFKHIPFRLFSCSAVQLCTQEIVLGHTGRNARDQVPACCERYRSCQAWCSSVCLCVSVHVCVCFPPVPPSRRVLPHPSAPPSAPPHSPPSPLAFPSLPLIPLFPSLALSPTLPRACPPMIRPAP